MVLDPSDKPVLRWCLVRVRRQRSPGPLLLGSAHTRAPNKTTSFAHKGGIKPLCAVLCCVIPSLVCATGNCALEKSPQRHRAHPIRDPKPGSGPGQHQYCVGGSTLRCYNLGMPGHSGGPDWMLHRRRARMPVAPSTALSLAALLAAAVGPFAAYSCAKRWTRRNIAELVTGDPGLVDRINRHAWALSDGAIAVVGPPDSQQAHDAHQALEDTGLFKKGAIAHIPPQDLAGAARADLIILTEDALSAQTDGTGRARLLDDVLSSKRGIHAGLIGYAPAGNFTDSEFQAIGSEPITSVTRTRGRLVNDAISMLTTLSRL